MVLHCIYLEKISFEHAVVVDVFPIFVSIFNQIDQRGGRQEVKAINNNNFIVSKIVGQEMRTIGITIKASTSPRSAARFKPEVHPRNAP